MALLLCKCIKCENSIGIIQYAKYYYCKSHYTEYYCVKCFENGNKNCVKCQKSLVSHNSYETKKNQINNNLLF